MVTVQSLSILFGLYIINNFTYVTAHDNFRVNLIFLPDFIVQLVDEVKCISFLLSNFCCTAHMCLLIYDTPNTTGLKSNVYEK